MLDGPGNLDEIKPRKNRLLHRNKRTPIDPLSSESSDKRYLHAFLIVVSISIFLTLAIIFFVTVIMNSDTLQIPDAVKVMPSSILFIISIVAIGFISVTVILVPLSKIIGRFLREYRRDKERQERSWQRYMKKITRLDRQIAAGAKYKVGDDGEIIVVKNAPQTEADANYQINKDGELTSTKEN